MAKTALRTLLLMLVLALAIWHAATSASKAGAQATPSVAALHYQAKA